MNKIEKSKQVISELLSNPAHIPEFLKNSALSVRSYLRRIFSKPVVTPKAEAVTALFRDDDTEAPLVTGQERPKKGKALGPKESLFSRQQVIAGVVVVAAIGSCEAKFVSMDMNRDFELSMIGEHPNAACNIDRSLPNAIWHPTAWIREVRQRLVCLQRSDEDIRDSIVRTNRAQENAAFSNRCSHPAEELDRDHFAAFYANHDVRFFATSPNADISTVATVLEHRFPGGYQSLRAQSTQERVRGYLARTITHQGRFTVTRSSFPVLDVGSTNRRRAQLVAQRFHFYGEHSGTFTMDDEIRHWYTNRLLREGRERGNQREAVQRIFAISPYCALPSDDGTSTAEQRSLPPCNIWQYMSVLYQLGGLNYQDKMRIMQELRAMFVASEATALSCAGAANSDCSAIEAESTPTAQQALEVYLETLRLWQRERVDFPLSD